MLSAIILIGIVLTVVTAWPVAVQLRRDHPHGLIILFFVEFWERFSFYGMRSLLIFYLTQHFLFDDGFSARAFGSFTTLAYLLPLLAGVIADRYIGARRAVVFGAVLLVAGHLLMAIEGPPAKQVLAVGGESFPVTTLHQGEARKLAVVYREQNYARSHDSSGVLHVEGLPEGAPLAASIPAGGFTLGTEARDPFFVNLLFLALSFIAMGVGFLKGNI